MLSHALRGLVAALLMMAAALPAAGQPRRGPLVLAAASLQESLNAAADDWARQGHARPVLSFAASSSLARQVLAGAPADLFVSADEAWMDAVQARRLLAPHTRATLARNRLVIVAPVDRARAIDLRRRGALLRALAGGRLALADPDAVPAGRYACAALRSLGAWQAAAPRIVRAENVRAALALVERGVAAHGIVYATDARASRRVAVVATFPAASHPPIVYPVARLASSRHPDAEAFRRFLLSARAARILARFGFGAR